MYRLFDELAHRYDLHTPPDHYQHDHAFVLEQAVGLGSPCRMLDVGCGTGVLVEKALRAGVVVTGIDASAAMVRVAEGRAGKGAVAVRRMQEIEDEAAYDLVVSLSWTINYCAGRDELVDVLRRLHRALRDGGRLLLQVAHAAHVNGRLMEDREPGPAGEPDDVVFLFRFVRLDADALAMRAEYVYACKSLNELDYEQHLLQMTDARAVAACAHEVGFRQIEVFDSFRRDPLHGSPSPFVSATKPFAAP
jgi:SAM-dependent methyltransferase